MADLDLPTQLKANVYRRFCQRRISLPAVRRATRPKSCPHPIAMKGSCWDRERASRVGRVCMLHSTMLAIVRAAPSSP